MEYVNAVIGDMEMYVPVNDKLGDLILLAQRRLNYQKHIAKMRKACKGKIESEVVVMDSDFFYALEDVLEEEGYDSIDVCQYSLIFSLSPNDMSDLCDLYAHAGQINEAEQNYIMHNKRGTAFFISSSQNRTNIDIVTSNFIESLF